MGTIGARVGAGRIPPKICLTIRFDEETYSRLASKAIRDDISMAKIMNRAIKAVLDADDKERGEA